MSIISYEIVDTTSERKKNLNAKYGIHGVIEPLTINSTNVFRYKYQVHESTQWFFYINSQIWGVSTLSSQFTPELFSCRLMRLGETENKANMHNFTHPILNAQWFSDRMIYNGDVFKKWKIGDYVEDTTQGYHSHQRHWDIWNNV